MVVALHGSSFHESPFCIVSVIMALENLKMILNQQLWTIKHKHIWHNSISWRRSNQFNAAFIRERESWLNKIPLQELLQFIFILCICVLYLHFWVPFDVAFVSLYLYYVFAFWAPICCTTLAFVTAIIYWMALQHNKQLPMTFLFLTVVTATQALTFAMKLCFQTLIFGDPNYYYIINAN